MSHITLEGARVHNLQGVTLQIPYNALTVICGVSGSGKSSLAFDTLFAEGQRRYVETFSPQARQFLDQLERPAIDRIEGIPPAIAVRQATRLTNPTQYRGFSNGAAALPAAAVRSTRSTTLSPMWQPGADMDTRPSGRTGP